MRCWRGALGPHHGGFHRLHHRQQLAPGLGQPVAPGLTRKQRCAHLLFQRLDAARHGGVLHRQTPGRRSQRARAGQLQKIAQVVPIHTGRPLSRQFHAPPVMCIFADQKCTNSYCYLFFAHIPCGSWLC